MVCEAGSHAMSRTVSQESGGRWVGYRESPSPSVDPVLLGGGHPERLCDGGGVGGGECGLLGTRGRGGGLHCGVGELDGHGGNVVGVGTGDGMDEGGLREGEQRGTD